MFSGYWALDTGGANYVEGHGRSPNTAKAVLSDSGYGRKSWLTVSSDWGGRRNVPQLALKRGMYSMMGAPCE